MGVDTKNMRNPKEREIQKAILTYLKSKGFVVFKHLNVGIKKPNGSYIPLPAGDKGISDIIGCSPGIKGMGKGQFISIEVKTVGGRPTPEQIDFMRRVRENGGIALLARSLDDVMDVLTL